MSDSESEDAEKAGRDQDWEDWEDDEECHAPTRSLRVVHLLDDNGLTKHECRDILYHEKEHDSPETCIKHCAAEYVGSHPIKV